MHGETASYGIIAREREHNRTPEAVRTHMIVLNGVMYCNTQAIGANENIISCNTRTDLIFISHMDFYVIEEENLSICCNCYNAWSSYLYASAFLYRSLPIFIRRAKLYIKIKSYHSKFNFAYGQEDL